MWRCAGAAGPPPADPPPPPPTAPSDHHDADGSHDAVVVTPSTPSRHLGDGHRARRRPGTGDAGAARPHHGVCCASLGERSGPLAREQPRELQAHRGRPRARAGNVCAAADDGRALKGSPRGAVVASASVSVKSGQTRLVSIHLTPAGRKLLAARRRGTIAADDEDPRDEGSHARAHMGDRARARRLTRGNVRHKTVGASRADAQPDRWCDCVRLTRFRPATSRQSVISAPGWTYMCWLTSAYCAYGRRWTLDPGHAGASRVDRAEARACTCGAARERAALHVVGLYEHARPEDWIGQLTEINRTLLEENNGAPPQPAGRRAASCTPSRRSARAPLAQWQE